MDYVRVGTNNIQTINDATRFLDDGGDISGVPDDFLLEAIRGSSRFTQGNAETAGINGAPRLFTDTRTGRRYLSKYEQTSYIPNEDIAEVLGNNIAGRLGFPVGGMRFAGPATMARRNKNGKFNNISASPGRPILLEHADNYTTGGVRRPEWNMNDDPSQLVNAAILDYILLNPDRHTDNYFVSGDQQRPRFVPIDASMGFQNARYRPKDIEPGEQPDLSGVEGIRAFARSVRNGTVPSIRKRVFNAPINQLTTIRQELRDEIARTQQRLRASEERTPFEIVARKAVLAAGSTDPGSTTRRPRETTVEFDQNGVNDSTNRFIQYPSRRINAFLNLTPDEILDALLS